MRDNFGAFEQANTKIVGVSVDKPSECLEMQTNLGLQFPLLSDEKRLVIEEYRASDTVQKNDKTIAKTVNLVFKKGGELVYRHTSDYKYRTSVANLLEIVNGL